jgi:uncharacterized membrane protein
VKAAGPHLRAPAHWQAALAMLALLAIYWLVVLQLVPRLGAAVAALFLGVLAAIWVARRRSLTRLTRGLALLLVALATAALIASVALVIAQLLFGPRMVDWLGRVPTPAELLRNAALIWLSNVLVFAAWYWEIDAGGPAVRHRTVYRSNDLMFPQRQREDGGDEWTPDFVDYLFLAFNSSTALSPTDTMILSRRMKALMMCQALISLAVLAVVAARAVNAIA